MNLPISIRPIIPLCFSWMIAAVLAPVSASGQTTDQVRQQAETQLKQMTPEEIDQKLKELGLSRDEATATIIRGFLKVDIEGLPPMLNEELKKAVRASEQELF